ncbi:hypothetical protein ACHAXH_001594 [Discostella pseudostelligera]
MHSSPCLLGSTLFLIASGTGAQEPVEGYSLLGRGSCQDGRGQMYSYLQRTTEFPNAETCGRQECDRFLNMQSYRGFEYSASHRCTCLFDYEKVPPVPNNSTQPTYVTDTDGGNGVVAGLTGTPGAYCYKNSGSMVGGAVGFYTATILAGVIGYALF